jgi:hypothetical protein
MDRRPDRASHTPALAFTGEQPTLSEPLRRALQIASLLLGRMGEAVHSRALTGMAMIVNITGPGADGIGTTQIRGDKQAAYIKGDGWESSMVPAHELATLYRKGGEEENASLVEALAAKGGLVVVATDARNQDIYITSIVDPANKAAQGARPGLPGRPAMTVKKTDSTRTHLERMVDALVMAAPWALAPRFKDLGHCAEASVGGAGALRRRRIDARVIPCAFMACDPSGDGFSMSVGHSAESAYAWLMAHGTGDALPFEEWKAQATGLPDAEAALHLVIEAKHCGKRILIDLTAGQATERSAGRIRVPRALAFKGEGWPTLDIGGGCFVAYGPSPYKGRAAWRDANQSGLIADMDELMGVALAVDLDAGRFDAEMHRIARAGGIDLGGGAAGS